jgi:hypothetical protein
MVAIWWSDVPQPDNRTAAHTSAVSGPAARPALGLWRKFISIRFRPVILAHGEGELPPCEAVLEKQQYRGK